MASASAELLRPLTGFFSAALDETILSRGREWPRQAVRSNRSAVLKAIECQI
jgi:hypothetical protein